MNTELSDDIDPASLLAWHVAMGVDEAIAEEPVDRFTAAAIPQQPLKQVQQQTQTPVPVKAKPAQPTSGAGAETALKVAQTCNTIEELKQALENFDGGLLKRSAKNTVFSDGSPEASLMIIGDVPGSEEDRVGTPFVGPAGSLLDKMLASISLDRADGAYLTDFVPWRPLGNAKPGADILAMCKPFALRHIELAKPKIVVMMGGIPAKTLLDTDESISRLRGKWKKLTINNQEFDAIPMVHPNYLLNQPHQKRGAWHDLLAIREKLSS